MQTTSKLLFSLGIAAAIGGTALADGDGGNSGDPSTPSSAGGDPAGQAVNPISVVQGAGVKVGESTTLYPQVGVETGFISNVFYEDHDIIGAGLLRVLGEAGIGSLSAQRFNDNNPPESTPASPFPDRGGFVGRADVYAAYDQYLSDNDNVTSQGGFSGGIVLRGVANPGRPMFITFLEHFERVIRATNFESSQDTDRDINTLTIRLNYQPYGRTLGGYLYYSHSLDLFEEEAQRFADRLDHRFGVRVNWQWLPYTRLYFDGSWGVYGGIGSSSTKVSSFPLTLIAGAQTLLSVNTTLSARVGYNQGFYSEGPDFATVTGGVQLGYRYSPLGRIVAMYSYEHQDSINANFYRDHLLLASIEQQLIPVLVFARPELRLRRYDGITENIPGVMPSSNSRNDTIFALTAGVRYNFRDWIAASIEYRLAIDHTDFTYSFNGMVDDPSYTRHEVLLGVRAAL